MALSAVRACVPEAARRTITLPQTLVDELAAQLVAYPAAKDGLAVTSPMRSASTSASP